MDATDDSDRGMNGVLILADVLYDGDPTLELIDDFLVNTPLNLDVFLV